MSVQLMRVYAAEHEGATGYWRPAEVADLVEALKEKGAQVCRAFQDGSGFWHILGSPAMNERVYAEYLVFGLADDE